MWEMKGRKRTVCSNYDIISAYISKRAFRKQVVAYSCNFLRNNISTSNKRRDDYIKHPLLVKTGGYHPIPPKIWGKLYRASRISRNSNE